MLSKIHTEIITTPDLPLLKQLFAVELSAHVDPWSIDQIAACFSEYTDVIALYERQKLLGFAVVRVIAGEAEILTIGIVKSRQGQGLGTILLQAVLDACLERQGTCCFLEVREHNVPALALYRHFGFKPLGMRRNYYRATADHPAENAITMRCELISIPAKKQR